ncbi:MAG: preprotein translocase subunit Sec61beta [Candidatus ainarchaeum sp.]|nr:preprotein translocase subunit Sec61beta [Candidatus ainarchaeum sp.]
MVKFQSGPNVSGPSSSIGIMRFFDAETPGPKITPEFFIGLAIIVIVVLLVIKNLL